MPRARGKPPVGTVTFLFTDIEGSTRLVNELGSAWAGVVRVHHAIVRDAIRRHGGRERGTEGDSFFVAFANAAAALSAAAEIQRGINAETWPSGRNLRVRIGLHTGEGRLSADDYVGLDVHRAARIAAAGHGGQVLISDATRALIERNLPERVSVRDLGEYRLKDLPEAEHLYQLVFEDLPSDFPPLRTVGRMGGELPGSLTSFIGREKELQDIRRLLAGSRLLTLVGPGGTGKTRLVEELGKQAANDFRDGAWFVGLATIRDPEQVPSAIARSVGVPEVGGKPPEAVLTDHFRERNCLLILDNFEHLIGAAPIVGRLLAAASELTVVATSQTRLRLSGEQVYPVPPLAIPATDAEAMASDAVRLFIDRAARARPDMESSRAIEEAIAEICRRLEGIPLAIELAAARVRLLGIEEILTRVDHRLELLSGGPSDVPDRLRTMRGAIAWSCELLDPAEAALLRRIAVFSGGASIDAIEAVCSDNQVPVVLPTLDELVSHSLVIPERAQQGTRFRMLEAVREFNLERLRESGDEPVIRRRHASWFSDRLERLIPAWRLDPLAGRGLEAEVGNIRAALDWASDAGEVSLGLRLCGAWRFWTEVGSLREGYERTRTFLAMAKPEIAPGDRMRALEAIGGLAWYLGDAQSALAAYRERLELAERVGDPADVAEALYDLSYGLAGTVDFAGAARALASAQAQYAELGDRIGVARCRNFQASVALFEQRVGDARAILDEVIPVFREGGDVSMLGQALGSLAFCELLEGNVGATDRLFTEIITLGVERTSVVGLVIATGIWSRIRKLTGHPEEAALLAGAFEALSATYGVTMPPQLAGLMDLAEARLGVVDELDAALRERLLDEGRRMTIDQLHEFARSKSRAIEAKSEP